MGYDMYWRQKPEDEEAAVAEATAVFDAACRVRDALPREERGTFDGEAYKRARDAGELVSIDDDRFEVGRSDRWKKAQDVVHAAYAELNDARTSYFRLNIWGMSTVCDIMERIGMAFTDDDIGPWPKAGDFGIDDDDAWAVKYAGTEDDDDEYIKRRAGMGVLTTENAKKYITAMETYLSAHAKIDTPGIPTRKFSSNDSWHVLPVECEAALKIYLKWLDDNGADAARNFIENHFEGGGGFALWNRWVAWVGKAAQHGGFEVH